MPTYKYLCSTCGEKDIFQPITDNALTVCPDCNTIDIKKVFGSVGISFKGSGFYSTDSRST